jgi:hypothetical protein
MYLAIDAIQSDVSHDQSTFEQTIVKPWISESPKGAVDDRSKISIRLSKKLHDGVCWHQNRR